jgi:hypothetical protein
LFHLKKFRSPSSAEQEEPDSATDPTLNDHKFRSSLREQPKPQI